VERREATVLIVPSVLVPSESNWLINPLHPQFGLIHVHPPEPFRYDQRLF
jgi:RES domain-containing protein